MEPGPTRRAVDRSSTQRHGPSPIATYAHQRAMTESAGALRGQEGAIGYRILQPP